MQPEYGEIAGTITPTREDNIVDVLVPLLFTWEFTDQCNRQITHTQVLDYCSTTSTNIYQSASSNLPFLIPNIPDDDELPPLNYTQ